MPLVLETVVQCCLTCCLTSAGGGGGADLLGQESAGGAGAAAPAQASSHVDLLSQLEAPSPAAAPAQAAAASSPGQYAPVLHTGLKPHPGCLCSLLLPCLLKRAAANGAIGCCAACA